MLKYGNLHVHLHADEGEDEPIGSNCFVCLLLLLLFFRITNVQSICPKDFPVKVPPFKCIGNMQ